MLSWSRDEIRRCRFGTLKNLVNRHTIGSGEVRRPKRATTGIRGASTWVHSDRKVVEIVRHGGLPPQQMMERWVAKPLVFSESLVQYSAYKSNNCRNCRPRQARLENHRTITIYRQLFLPQISYNDVRQLCATRVEHSAWCNHFFHSTSIILAFECSIILGQV